MNAPPEDISKVTARRLRHVQGYLELEMLDAADAEIAAIEESDARAASTLAAKAWLAEKRADYHTAAWLGKKLTERVPQYEPGWVHWAHALRMTGDPQEAALVLHHAQSVLEEPTCALFFELANCYREQGIHGVADAFLHQAAGQNA